MKKVILALCSVMLLAASCNGSSENKNSDSNPIYHRLSPNQQIVQDELNAVNRNSRDQKRLSDMRQLSMALDLYFQDHKSYPASLNDLAPTYLNAMPIDPTPADNPPNSDVCNQNNEYKYLIKEAGMSYQVTFCIGEQNFGGLNPGINTLSPNGFNN